MQVWPEGTNPELASYEAFKVYIKELFSIEPWSNNIGKKGIKVIRKNEDEPDTNFIRLSRMSGRTPYSMGDGNISFLEYHFSFSVEIISPETDGKTPNSRGSKVTLTNPRTNTSVSLGNSGDILSNISNAIRTTMELPEWIVKLSDLGIHNIILGDESEVFTKENVGNESPLRMEFDNYVLITKLL